MHGECPFIGRAPRHRTHFASVLVRDIFEIQRRIGAFAGGDQIGAGKGDRHPHFFLITGQHHLDIGILQCAGIAQSTQCGQDDHHAALVVAYAGAEGALAFDESR